MSTSVHSAPHIRKAVESDIIYMTIFMRDIDKEECESVTGGEYPIDDMLMNVLNDPESETLVLADADDIPVVLFGAESDVWLDGKVIWMLATNDYEKYKVSIYKVALDYVKDQLDTHGFLCNYISPANTMGISWLRSIGFTVEDTPTFQGMLPFYIKKNNKNKEVINV